MQPNQELGGPCGCPPVLASVVAANSRVEHLSETCQMASLGCEMADPHEIEKFIATMPARYIQTFEAAAIEQHARTIRARGTRAVNLGLFDSPGRIGTALCVVAPDRPGLLAITTLAFVTCGLDIIAAEVFHSASHRDLR